MKPLQKGIFLFLFLILFLGCTGLTPGPRVEKGERVRVDYTCRTETREVIDTTTPAVAKDESLAKSRVFAQRPDMKPLRLVAGEDLPNLKPREVLFLDEEIGTRLAHAVVGREKGKSLEVILESRIPEGLEDSHRYRMIPRIRTAPRIQIIPGEIYRKDYGRLPEKGEILTEAGQAYAEVIALDPDNITIKLITDPLRTFDTPWGQARETGDDKEVRVTIEAEVGTLVRTGGLIGRISEINEKNIIVDYGHPFGGQTLNCTVEILDNEEAKGTK